MDSNGLASVSSVGKGWEEVGCGGGGKVCKKMGGSRWVRNAGEMPCFRVFFRGRRWGYASEIGLGAMAC